MNAPVILLTDRFQNCSYNQDMPNYHRFREGSAYFFTVVTYDRLPILTTEVSRKLLHTAWQIVAERFPFTTTAICLLPEHIHCIWVLPEGDQNYSVRWKEIKSQFTKRYLSEVSPEETLNPSRQKRGEAAVWQRRFWEHAIRDDEDMARHIEYIHYNPVKHGHVEQVKDWNWSSFHRYLAEGFYDPEWGKANLQLSGEEFGE